MLLTSSLHRLHDQSKWDFIFNHLPANLCSSVTVWSLQLHVNHFLEHPKSRRGNIVFRLLLHRDWPLIHWLTWSTDHNMIKATRRQNRRWSPVVVMKISDDWMEPFDFDLKSLDENLPHKCSLVTEASLRKLCPPPASCTFSHWFILYIASHTVKLNNDFVTSVQSVSVLCTLSLTALLSFRLIHATCPPHLHLTSELHPTLYGLGGFLS